MGGRCLYMEMGYTRDISVSWKKNKEQWWSSKAPVMVILGWLQLDPCCSCKDSGFSSFTSQPIEMLLEHVFSKETAFLLLTLRIFRRCTYGTRILLLYYLRANTTNYRHPIVTHFCPYMPALALVWWQHTEHWNIQRAPEWALQHDTCMLGFPTWVELSIL